MKNRVQVLLSSQINHSQGEECIDYKSFATACFFSSSAATTSVTEHVAIYEATSDSDKLDNSLHSSISMERLIYFGLVSQPGSGSGSSVVNFA